MKVRILCVGKIKDQYYQDAITEFKKRLRPFCQLEIIEVKNEKESPSLTKEMVIARESERLIKKMSDGYFFALEPDGKQMSSEEFASKIESLINTGNTPINFIIGGSYGLSDEIRKKCDSVLSFSQMTFPHELFRIILLEQIFRAFKIINNQTYHK